MTNSMFWFLMFFIPVMGMMLGALAAEEIADAIRKKRKKRSKKQKREYIAEYVDSSPISYIKCKWRGQPLRGFKSPGQHSWKGNKQKGK